MFKFQGCLLRKHNVQPWLIYLNKSNFGSLRNIFNSLYKINNFIVISLRGSYFNEL